MSLHRKIDLFGEGDISVVRANVPVPRREKSRFSDMIAVRRGDRVFVRNVYRDREGLIVANMGPIYYPLVRADGKIPHRGSGIRLDRLQAVGFRIHRNPFRISQPLRNATAELPEDDFNRWWIRHFHPGCDAYGFLNHRRKLTKREVLIRDFYANGYRWTPVRMRQLAKSMGTDIESLCAAIRLPLYVFGWYEEVYYADPCNVSNRVLDLLGPAFLLLDFIRAGRTGDSGSVFFPLSELRGAPATTEPATQRAA